MDDESAIGQVITIVFKEPLEHVLSSKDELETVLVCEPKQNRLPKFKFPGGMMQEIKDNDVYRDETPEEAASRETQEETGVWCPPKNFRILQRSYKRRGGGEVGSFPVYLMEGYGADFSRLHNPVCSHHPEFGQDGEIPIKTRFGNVLIPGYAWDIPTQRGRPVEFLQSYIKLLESALVT